MITRCRPALLPAVAAQNWKPAAAYSRAVPVKASAELTRAQWERSEGQPGVLRSASGTSALILTVDGESSRSDRQFNHACSGVAR